MEETVTKKNPMTFSEIVDKMLIKFPFTPEEALEVIEWAIVYGCDVKIHILRKVYSDGSICKRVEIFPID